MLWNGKCPMGDYHLRSNISLDVWRTELGSTCVLDVSCARNNGFQKLTNKVVGFASRLADIPDGSDQQRQRLLNERTHLRMS